MKFRFYCAIGLVFFLSSCSKHNVAISNVLIGSWEWIRTDGGIADNIHDTPASTGKNIELILSSNTYSILTNGVITSQGTYTLSNQNNKTVIDFSSPNLIDLIVIKIESNILTLSDGFDDGTTSQYTRN